MKGHSLSVGLIALLSVTTTCLCQTTLKAKINMTGITGDVSFFQSAPSQTTNVQFNLQGLSGNVEVEIRQSWVDYTLEHKCADDVIGNRYSQSTVWSITTGSEVKSIEASVLSNVQLLMGRSILITKGNEKACGTLMHSSADYSTAVVRLQDKVSGEIWFRQAEGQRTEILADIFDPSASGTTMYKWKLFTGTNADCKTMSSIFNPTASNGSTCSLANQANCPIGNLEDKLGDVSVGQTVGSNRKLFHDTNLPLSGTNTVIGTHLVIMDNTDTIVSCGPVMQVNEKSAVATLNKDGVTGSVTFKQNSPFDITVLYFNLIGMNGGAGGLHVHVFPVPSQIEADDQLCSVDSVAGHWNPFNKAFPAPAGATTPDMFEVGDISGKFELMDTKQDYFATLHDVNMPLFGPNSVIGRSVVIHRNPSGTRWVCANIEAVGARAVAVAKFRSSVIGTIIFSQALDDPTSDTWVYGELNYADGVTQQTKDHMWMIHNNKVSQTATSNYCSTVGGMYNPFGVKTDGDYGMQCKPSNPYRCQVGDGTRLTKHLTIRSDTGKAQKFFYTVKNMPLSGPGSIIGKSAVIHAANNVGTVLDCANIYHLRTREAIVDSWSNDVEGYFKFSQLYSHINSLTEVSINITGMNNIAGNYHVHVFSVPLNSANPCSGKSVAGHYNPFNVVPANSPAPKKGTYEKYEVGDLSGKNGRFENMTSYTGGYSDNMLSLYGVRSVVGRSVVIHKMSDGSRWSCGTIRENEVMTGGRMHQAIANFTDSKVSGHVILTQYIYPDGAMSDTSVYLHLNYTDGRAKTSGHKISIGKLPAWGDRESASGRCSSTGGTFNPFKVNTQTGYSECSSRTPLRCAAGDLSSKLGTYSVGGGKMFNTDVNLPLIGKYSVIGRSLVIGSANGEAGHLACSNIMPVQAVTSSVATNKPTAKSLLDMAMKFAIALDTHPWNVAVFGDDTKGDCSSYSVYFMGPYASDLKKNFENKLRRSDQSLGVYTPTTCSADKCQTSVLLLAVILLCKKVLEYV